MFRGHKFREYDTFTEITWNIKSRKKFFIGLDLSSKPGQSTALIFFEDRIV